MEPVHYYAMAAGVFSSVALMIVCFIFGHSIGRREGVKFIMSHFPTMTTGEFLVFIDAAKRKDIIFKPIPTDEFQNEVAH